MKDINKMETLTQISTQEKGYTYAINLNQKSGPDQRF